MNVLLQSTIKNYSLWYENVLLFYGYMIHIRTVVHFTLVIENSEPAERLILNFITKTLNNIYLQQYKIHHKQLQMQFLYHKVIV